MEGTCENDRKIKILHGPEIVKEGTPGGDTTTNLHIFSSRFFWVPTENLEKVNCEASGPKTRQMPCQEAAPAFQKFTKLMNFSRNWTHIRRIGLRIKPFESQVCYQSNGNPPDPQNCHKKFKIDQNPTDPTGPTVH